MTERRHLPVSPETCSVLGIRVRADSPAWLGLDFSRATTATKLFSARPCPHLCVPFCHPEDQPEGWDDDMIYRVYPLMEAGRKWKGRKVISVAIEPAPDRDPPWVIVVEYAGKACTRHIEVARDG